MVKRSSAETSDGTAPDEAHATGDAGGDPASGATPRSPARRAARGGRRRRTTKGDGDANVTAATGEGGQAAGGGAVQAEVPAPPRSRARGRRKKKDAEETTVSAESPRGEVADAAQAPPDEGGEEGVSPAGAQRASRRARKRATAEAAERIAETGVPAAGASGEKEESTSADGGEPRKRRRRGVRGGRRVRAREARRAAALASAEDERAGSSAPETALATAAEEEVTSAAATAVESAGEDERTGVTTDAASGGRAGSGRRRGGRRGGRKKKAPAEGEPRADTTEGADELTGEVPGPIPEPPAAAPPAGGDATLPSTEGGTTSGEDLGETRAKKSRRGGRRAGRGAGAAVRESPPEEAAPETGDDAEPASARGRRRDRRRPRAIVRQEGLTGADADAVEGPALTTGRRPEVTVEAPKRKLILVTEDSSELRVALVEDGRLAEVYFERPEKRSYLGDIYRGRVENVLAGIDAAFVDFGLDKNGFLYVDEVKVGDGDRRGRRIADVLKPGQDVVVQVMKDPMGSKGARLTMHISLAGRYVVYVPGGSGVGVSRRLGQAERERLRESCKQLRVKNAGLIVRTAAEGKGLEEIRRDVRFLSRLWSRLKKKADTAPTPGLVHQEVDIALEVTRDLFNESVESLIVDDAKRHKAIVAFLEKVAPELAPKVRLHTGSEPLFEAYGIEQQISRALERRVPLPSGGNIVIDHAEALTVIDVNSGRYTSGRGLEDTILKTNLEAAREVVRQLRLRDIGGIIIIDFIDMARVKNRETVLATLEAELDTDRTKTYVVELSPLGLVEMTRQNTTDGARGILTRTCACCQGKARTLSEETVALNVERRLRVQSRRSGAKACLVEVNAGVAERLAAGGRLKALEKEAGRRIFLEGSSSAPVDAFRFIAEGSVESVQAQRIPVREGQEVDVELEFALTYSPRDAVGYVDGYMVIVDGGRSFVGERRRVRITSTSRTGASAVLTGAKGATER